MSSDWKYSSGRKGSPNPPIKRKTEMAKCPECKQEVMVYPSGDIAKHKVFIKGTDKWKWCSKKKMF